MPPTLRVAVPRRSAAHGHRPLRTLRAAWASRHRRPLAAPPTPGWLEHTGRLRLRARDRRRPLTAGLRRAAQRRDAPRPSQHSWQRALDWFASTRDQHQAADDRQRLELRPQPLPARAPRRPEVKHLRTQPYRPQTNGKVERFHQTHGQRVGLRAQLPLTPPPQPSPATLARALQHAQTTQRHREPATHQPRSQPTWAGQLGTARGPVAPRSSSAARRPMIVP